MAYISTIPPDRSDGELRSIYGTIGSARGGVGNILQVQSLNPPSLKAHFDPGDMTGEDIRSLRTAGFGEDEILEICQVAAYFAFVNRLASGLGVELEG